MANNKDKKPAQKQTDQDLNLPLDKLKIPEEVKEKLEKIKVKLEKFKDEVVKKFEKYIVGVALLPPPKGSKPVKDEIKVLVLVDDSDVKKMSRFELHDKLNKIVKDIAKDLDKNIKPEVLTLFELRENCFDGKYEILEDIALSFIFHDPVDILAALKISEIHKSMVLKKFEKYIVSYVAAGSLFRGEKSHDIDVWIVVDDTDVKKMSRFELKDKLGAIIRSMGAEASMITGIKKIFHIQTYILTDFWDSVKDANPVIFTFLRDGVPLFDRGIFMPWKLLLKMGRVKPSAEAIDMQMDLGERLLTRTRQKLLSVVGEDLYYATLNPAQAALMLYGIPPPTHKETIKLLDEIFVKKEKLLEKKYVDILEKTFKYFKGIEHGKVKEVSGKEIDDLLKDVEDYLKRIDKLFKQIEKRREGSNVIAICENCFAVVRDVLSLEGAKNIPEDKLVKIFEEKLVKPNKVPERFLNIFKDVINAKKEYKEKRISKQEIEKVRRESDLFVKALLEYVQRRRGYELEKAKIRVRYNENKFGEVLILEDSAFIVMDIDAKDKDLRKTNVGKDGSLGKLTKAKVDEVEKAVSSAKVAHRVFIKEKTFESLKDIFGKDVEILVNY